MTYNLSSREKDRITSVFDSIPDDLEYVVLRNYSNLPDSVPGVDIDILVDSQKADEFEAILRSHGFDKYGNLYTRYRSLMKKLAFRPTECIQFVLSKPKRFVYLIMKLYSDEYHWGKEGFKMKKLQFDQLEVDFYNHLAYQSPTNQRFLGRTMIRVDPYIEKSMLENRQKSDGFYIPSPPDELVHMICRGVFDHNGEFRDYYTTRCDELWDTVSSDNDYLDTYHKLINRIFFKGVEIVNRNVAEGNYNKIKKDLVSNTSY